MYSPVPWLTLAFHLRPASPRIRVTPSCDFRQHMLGKLGNGGCSARRQVCLRREVTTSQRWKSPRFSSSTFYTSAISWELGHLQFTFSEEGTHTVVRIYLYYNYPKKFVFATLEITYISYKCVNRHLPQPKNISTEPTSLSMIHHAYSGLQIFHSSVLIFIRLLSGQHRQRRLDICQN